MESQEKPQGDTRLLTVLQMRVYLLDCDGLTPTQISGRTGLSIKRVSNIKRRLRDLGFSPLKFRRLPSEMPTKDKPVSVAEVLQDTDVPKSAFEPDDDELPDYDEPVTVVQRCDCGLIKPCYHPPLSAWNNSEGYRSDIVSHRSGHQYEPNRGNS